MVNRTRIVRWLRVLLPLIALALLSTMFLFSRGSDSESRIPYAQIDAEAVVREGRITAPEYAGVTGDGAQIALRAASAVPQSGGGAARDLRLDWVRDGLRADVTAPTGGVDGDRIHLDGGVVMETSAGWTINAPRLDAATDQSLLTADQGIDARAPFGTVTAGQMQMTAPAGDDAILHFSGGVRLLYQP
ncbi:hypothetical protein [Paracoccus sp. (in: a-proteobacteria)]|uniref:hypothetical protein n=1 Tax=Paracoccus sp. TaxID=267 RepID=UPI0026DF256B|nr:hypothetical protein [Paracoccus sp. (in: a-proteobacteria)]MDO5647015.1 hypothetical protein [Paracoccus sp. (in: a-proteobacteria)]